MTKHSLLIRLPNWLGDVMMALPSLYALQQLGIECHVLGRPWIRDILSETPFHLYVYPNHSFLQTISALQKIPIKPMLLLTNSLSSALTAKLAGKKCIAYRNNKPPFLLDHALKKPSGLHEVEYFWTLSKYSVEKCFSDLNFANEIPNHLHLPISIAIEDKMKKLLHAKNINSNYWVLCPSAAGMGEKNQSKIWAHWHSLSQALIKRGISLVACPGPGEENRFRQLIPDVPLLTDLNLAEYASVLKMANKVLANDSGPMHMGTAVGASVLVIFGTTDPKRTHPWGGEWIGSNIAWPSLEAVLEKLSLK